MPVLTPAHLAVLESPLVRLVPFVRDGWSRGALADLWAAFEQAGVLRGAFLQPDVPDQQRGDLLHFVQQMQQAVLFVAYAMPAGTMCGLVWGTDVLPGHHARLGCCFLREARGLVAKDAMTRAARVLADVYQLRVLYVYTTSRRARRFAEDLGAKVTGTLPGYSTRHGQPRDVWVLTVEVSDATA